MPKRPSPEAHVRPMSDVAVRPVEWLWPGWIPLGKVTVLDGDPGMGKSTLLLDLAARLSRDGLMPDGAVGPVGSSLILSAEDGEEDTIKPRLAAAGGVADAAVHAVGRAGRRRRGAAAGDTARPAGHRGGRGGARRPPARHRPAHGVSDRRGRQPRPGRAAGAVPAGAAGGAAKLRGGLPAAPEQRGGDKAIYRGGGSIGIVGAARTGLLVAADPDDPNVAYWRRRSAI